MEIQKLFNQQQEIYERGWDTFTTEYEQRNPPPEQSGWWQHIGMVVGLTAAMVVSSIFTVQALRIVFANANIDGIMSWVGSVGGFLMVDAILFVITHYSVNLAYKSSALEGSLNAQVLLYVAIGIAAFTFIVSLASNLYFMLTGFGVLQPDSPGLREWSKVVGILLGAAPPIQSIAIGSMVAMRPLQTIVERKSWENSRNAAWRRYRSKHGLDLEIEKRIARLSGRGEFHETFHERRETSAPKKKRVKLSEVAREVIENGDENLDTETMMSKYNISMGSTTKIRKLIETGRA